MILKHPKLSAPKELPHRGGNSLVPEVSRAGQQSPWQQTGKQHTCLFGDVPVLEEDGEWLDEGFNWFFS